MGMFREWTDRNVTALGEREPLGLWIMRQSGLDRAHYAEVEAQHKRDIESMDNTLAYWKRQAEDARLDVFNKGKVNEVLLKERDEARKDEKFWEARFDTCAGQLRGAEIECVRTRDSNAILIKANSQLMEQRDSARKEVAEAQAAHNMVVFELQQARKDSERFQRRNDVQAETIGFLQKQNDRLKGERDSAREVAEFWQSKHAEVIQALPTRPLTFRPAQDESLRHAR